MCIQSELISFLNSNSVVPITKLQHDHIVATLTTTSTKLGTDKCSEALMATVVVSNVPESKVQLSNYLISLKDTERALLNSNSSFQTSYY
jgi:hypothetical protein